MKFKLNSASKDIFLTFITEVIILITSFFVYRLIAKNFGSEGLGEYALVKRVINFLIPLLILGIWVGIPRYVAMAKNENQKSSYLKAGGALVLAFTFISVVLINLFKGNFAKIFFGSQNYAYLVLPFSFYLAGIVWHTFNYSYFRGRLMVKMFNFLQIANLSFAPIFVIVFFQDIAIERFIALVGIITLAIALASSLFYIKDLFFRNKRGQFKNSLKELLSFSLPRIPGTFAMTALFSLGPIFCAHFASIEEVGYLSLGQQVLSIAGVTMLPIGTILLPKVSNLISQGREEEIRKNINFLISAIFQSFIFISVQLVIFSSAIIKYWLGKEFLKAVPIMQIVVCALLFYAFYITMANILEALRFKPINTINIFISLLFFLLLSGFLLFIFKAFSPIISLSLAFLLTFVCLGVLTYFSIRKIYSEKLKKDLNWFLPALLINFLLGLTALLLKPLIVSNLYYLIIFELTLTFFYFLILWALKMEWTRQLYKKIIITNDYE